MLMRTKSTIHDTMQCGLELTANARKGIMKWVKDEHALFGMQEAFYVHIEKRPENRHGNMSFSIFFDNKTNNGLSKKLNGKVAVMECIYKNEGFLATGFHVRGRKEPVRTNRRYPVKLKFALGNRAGVPMPIEFYTSLRELPIAQERSDYVEKRISSWEGYLRIQEINADVADLTATFKRASLNEDFSKLSLVCSGLQGKDWNAIRGFSAKMIGLQNDIGNVVNVNRSKEIVEIELNQKYKGMARRNEWQPKSYKEVVFSNFAELSQVRRLRKGFKDLQGGLAANANLERVLFEERPVVRISKKQQNLIFHNELNKFQKEAVTGAMTSNDLYVIQGPPGTGKTTVISEICHQNVKAGLRTLVASQANLAVDNALGRLLSHQDIRILRYGRTESIEEEGKKFIEENVALNWKKETLHAINKQLQSNSNREKQLESELTSCEDQLEVLQKELVSLEEKIRLKEVARGEHNTRSIELAKLFAETNKLKNNREEIIENQAVLKNSANELVKEMNRLEQKLKTEDISSQTIAEMEKFEGQIEQLRLYINYRETSQLIYEIESAVATYHKELNNKQSRIEGLHTFLTEIHSTTKLDLLQRQLATFGIVPTSSTNSKITELAQLINTIKSDHATDKYSEWKELNDRLIAAIQMIENLLAKNGFLKQSVKRSVSQKNNTVKDIHVLIDRVGRFLVNPSTKAVLETRSYSAQKYDYLEKIAVALEVLRERRNYAQAQGAKFERQNQMLRDSKARFTMIKTEIIEYVNQIVIKVEQEKNIMQRDTENRQIEIDRLQKTTIKPQEIPEEVNESTPIKLLKEVFDQKESTYTAYEEKRNSLRNYAQELVKQTKDSEKNTQKLEANSVIIQDINEEIERLSEEIHKVEIRLQPLVVLIEQNPEELREQTLTSFYALEKKDEKLKIDKERLPITHALQKEWFGLLTDANDYDLDEIRKLYVQHANVIGTTCVASARRDFMEEYPTFDVVIIDEVSKATPPELLLPMLKGKKIILVGDHHQLPPLMGQETMEELLEESDNTKDKLELEKLLKESLFERLFRTLPIQNKTMLGIQYRMHESIMETITPFYEEGSYSLKCGLTDSDTMRDHLIESKYVQRNDHLLWFDMPNEPKYFEEKVKGGTSRFNQAELSMTKKLLLDLEEAMKNAKRNGTMKPEDKKSVGVISFYGEQVKRIDRLIEHELNPQHLNCRTGTVDKFQGMEMDVIILSFVRNHRDKGGDIGFARDYRRLNVALSRARELLIIVGSSEMFTIRAKHQNTKEMYGRLLEGIKMKNGFRSHVRDMKL